MEVETSRKCTPLWREAHFDGKTKNGILGALLEVELLKKCTPLWREARFEVKIYKTHVYKMPLQNAKFGHVALSRFWHVSLGLTSLP